MSKPPITRFRCMKCYTLYETEGEAIACCDDCFKDVYKCGECGGMFDNQLDASECCYDPDEEAIAAI